MGSLWTYQAHVDRVVDADTLEMTVDTGFRSRHVVHVRLKGVDAPELGTPEGEAAKQAVQTLLEGDQRQWNATVRTERIASGEIVSFERYVADVWVGDLNLAEWLVEQGHAERK